MKNVCDFLSELVTRSYSVLNWFDGRTESVAPDREYTAWVESAIQVLGYAELTEYQAKVRAVHEELQCSALSVARIAGLLNSAHECLGRGFAGRLKRVLHVEMFDSLASQGRGLLQTGHRIPAAVLGRIALEDWLRDEAEAAGIPNHDTAKASALNDHLKAANKFPQPKWRHIQALLDIGNQAAHGKDDQFTDDDVVRLLTFVESNCLG